MRYVSVPVPLQIQLTAGATAADAADEVGLREELPFGRSVAKAGS
jgi:hypothetical protein